MGKRCRQCANNKLRKERQFNYEYVKQIFEDNNCQLISKEYINASLHLEYICNCGNKSIITFANFQKGRRCAKCGLDKKSGSNNYNWNPDRKEIARRTLFRKRCYGILYSTLKATGRKKKTKSKILLGYDYKKLREHIEGNWTWTKTESNWEIDHVFPIKAFIDYGINDLSLINTLENLQPLPQDENRIKHTAYDKDAFEEWLKAKGFK